MTHQDLPKGHRASAGSLVTVLKQLPRSSVPRCHEGTGCQLLVLARCWNGCGPHSQVSGAFKPTVNKNTQFWVTQEAPGSRRKLYFCLWGSLTHGLASVSLPFLTGQRGESRCPSHPMKIPALFQACPLVRHASPKFLPSPLARAQGSQACLLVSGKAQLWLPVGREVTVSATWCLCSLSNLHLPAATSAGPPGKGWGRPFMHLGAAPTNKTRKTI